MALETSKKTNKYRRETRAKILDSALRLFATRGFHGTSIDAIAKSAAISKGLAYHYFDNKKAILQAIIEQGISEIERMMGEAAQIDDPFQQIVALIERTFSVIERDESYWRLFTGLLLKPDVWQDFGELFTRFLEEAIQQFQILFEKMDAADPTGEALMLAALLDGISLHFMMGKGTYPLQKAKNVLIQKYSRKNWKDDTK